MNRRQGERGSAGVDASIAITGLLMMLFLVVGGLRIAGTDGDVDAAARAGARAASQAYDSTAGQSAARAVVEDALASRGVACRNLLVTASGSWAPGGSVRVDVSCTIDLSDVTLAGLPGDRLSTGSAVEVVDVIRGGQP